MTPIRTMSRGLGNVNDMREAEPEPCIRRRRCPLMHTLRGYAARYVGKSDPTFVADNARLDREFTAARVSQLFELYAGGHTTALWQAHAVACLSLALDHLQAPVK
jgi:hypothetical protein